MPLIDKILKHKMCNLQASAKMRYRLPNNIVLFSDFSGARARFDADGKVTALYPLPEDFWFPHCEYLGIAEGQQDNPAFWPKLRKYFRDFKVTENVYMLLMPNGKWVELEARTLERAKRDAAVIIVPAVRPLTALLPTITLGRPSVYAHKVVPTHAADTSAYVRSNRKSSLKWKPLLGCRGRGRPKQDFDVEALRSLA